MSAEGWKDLAVTGPRNAMAEKILTGLGAGQIIAVCPASKAVSTKRRMRKRYVAEIEAREICALLPPSGRPCSSRITPPIPEDGPVEGRHRRLPQTSVAHAQHSGAAGLR